MSGRHHLLAALGIVTAGMVGAATACNSLSGVDDLVVGGTDAAGAQHDGTIGGDSSNLDGSPAFDSGVNADATSQGDGPGTDGTGRDADAGMPVDGQDDVVKSIDGAGDASQGTDASADSGSDASPDVEQDALGDSAANGDAADAKQDGTGPTGPCDGGTPLVVHSNGFGQSFSDCQPLGTYNVTQAFEACASSTGDAGACSVNPGGFICSGGNLVCTQNGSSCTCWRFEGHPGSAQTLTTGCNCLPNSAPVVWN